MCYFWFYLNEVTRRRRRRKRRRRNTTGNLQNIFAVITYLWNIFLPSWGWKGEENSQAFSSSTSPLLQCKEYSLRFWPLFWTFFDKSLDLEKFFKKNYSKFSLSFEISLGFASWDFRFFRCVWKIFHGVWAKFQIRPLRRRMFVLEHTKYAQ